MQKWRCERCTFIHVSEFVTKIPSRCPSCRSRRLRRINLQSNGNKHSMSSQEIYGILDRIPSMQIQEQEDARRLLKESGGVHILCLDKWKGRLGELLSKHEIEGYLSLISNQNFGLAVINLSLVAVSASSPIRSHVGVNPAILQKLRELL